MTNLTIGGLDVTFDHARELAQTYMNGPGLWSYPVYDRYRGNADPDTVGPQDALANWAPERGAEGVADPVHL